MHAQSIIIDQVQTIVSWLLNLKTACSQLIKFKLLYAEFWFVTESQNSVQSINTQRGGRSGGYL